MSEKKKDIVELKIIETGTGELCKSIKCSSIRQAKRLEKSEMEGINRKSYHTVIEDINEK